MSRATAHALRPFAFLLTVALLALPAIAEPQSAPVPAAEAAAKMTVPLGFNVTLFAGEPDIVQPIAMAFDGHGRLWVVENFSYPNWNKEGQGHDRVVILTDVDGDGKHDKRQVFYDRGVNLSGIELGFGGVWLCSAPNLIFIPDRNDDGVPDGEPEVLLDGWDMIKTKHNVFNSLIWGPDGWLWGCNGIQAESLIGRPGTPDAERTAMNCGVWRYHPTQKKFEVVATGTTNPWGLDFDELGEAFITNCVIKHLFHVIPGAHYDRMYGQDLNPHTYGLIPSCADHIHWGGGSWTTSRGGKGEHDAPGGGHAHSGCCVYLGTNFPDYYRNSIFMCNLHGNRLNCDVLELAGSSYVAKHGPDFMMANDEWFRGLAVKYGPDGGLYVSDWSDTGECHNYKEVDQRNGRIFKIVYGKPKRDLRDWEPVDWTKVDDLQLIALLTGSNEWNSRRARLTIQERYAGKALSAKDQFARFLTVQDDVGGRLRRVWGLHAAQQDVGVWLGDPSPTVRAWSVRLSLDGTARSKDSPSEIYKALARQAETETHPRVRLALASALQRIPPAERWELAEAMVSRADDAKDPCLPLMIWYGVEPLATVDAARTAALIGKCAIPLVRTNLVRRLVERDAKELAMALPPLVDWLAGQTNPELVRDVLEGMARAWRGRHDISRPENWASLAKAPFAADPQLTWLLDELSARLGDDAAREKLLDTLKSADAPAERRVEALTELVEMRYPPLAASLPALLSDKALRGPAARALSAFDDPQTPQRLLAVYAQLDDDDRATVVATLASRPKYAEALLTAVAANQVPKGDIPLTIVRQLKALKQKPLDEAIAKIWGALRPPSKDKQAEKLRWQERLGPTELAKADLKQGRAVFAKTCANCHVLFDAGKKIGPELTGSQRTNLDYVLDNVLDPSAAVARDYQMTQLVLADGRLLTGMIVEENDQTVTLQTPTERSTFAKADIEDRTRSPLSMMPEGIFGSLSVEDVLALVAYLASPQQVPLK